MRAAGLTTAAHGIGSEADGLGSSLALRLHGFTVHNRTAGSYGALSTTVQLKGFNMDVIPAPSGQLRGKDCIFTSSGMLEWCFLSLRKLISSWIVHAHTQRHLASNTLVIALDRTCRGYNQCSLHATEMFPWQKVSLSLILALPDRPRGKRGQALEWLPANELANDLKALG